MEQGGKLEIPVKSWFQPGNTEEEQNARATVIEKRLYVAQLLGIHPHEVLNEDRNLLEEFARQQEQTREMIDREKRNSGPKVSKSIFGGGGAPDPKLPPSQARYYAPPHSQVEWHESSSRGNPSSPFHPWSNFHV